MYLKKIPWINKVTCLKTKNILVNSVYFQPIWKGIHVLFPGLCNSDKACFWYKVMDNTLVSICFQIVLVHSNSSLCNRTLISTAMDGYKIWFMPIYEQCSNNTVLPNKAVIQLRFLVIIWSLWVNTQNYNITRTTHDKAMWPRRGGKQKQGTQQLQSIVQRKSCLIAGASGFCYPASDFCS